MPQMIEALQQALDAHADHAALRAVLLDAEGPHFSFGASVDRHMAERCAGMLALLHALVQHAGRLPRAGAGGVRGQCLGGGLEIALAGNRSSRRRMRVRPAEIRWASSRPRTLSCCPARQQSRAEGGCSQRPQHRCRAAPAIGWPTMLADDPVAAALVFRRTSCAAPARGVSHVRAARCAGCRDQSKTGAVERHVSQSLMARQCEGLAAFLEAFCKLGEPLT